MSISVSEMAQAVSECGASNSDDRGCRGIDIDILTKKSQKYRRQLDSLDSESQEKVKNQIRVFEEIINGVRGGKDPIRLIDDSDLKRLDNGIQLKVIQAKGTDEEILDSFYDREFRKSTNIASFASRIYSREELKAMIHKYNSSGGVDAFPVDMLEKLKKSMQGGGDIDKNLLPQSRQSLREELLSLTYSGNNTININYNEFSDNLRILNDKAKTARAEDTFRLPYDAAISIINVTIENVLCDCKDLLGDEKKGKAITNILIYPELLEYLEINQGEIDEDQFYRLCDILNDILRIKYAENILIDTAPYLGIGLPVSVRKRHNSNNAPAPHQHETDRYYNPNADQNRGNQNPNWGGNQGPNGEGGQDPRYRRDRVPPKKTNYTGIKVALIVVACLFVLSRFYSCTNSLSSGTGSGFMKPESLDAFSDDIMKIEYEGTAPFLTPKTVCQDVNWFFMNYSIDPKDNLKNGDTVVVSVETSDEEISQHKGRSYTVSERQKTYTVEGRPEYIMDADSLSEEDIDTLKSATENEKKHQIGLAENGRYEVSDDSYYETIVMLSREAPFKHNNYGNLVWVVYKAEYKSNSDGSSKTVFLPVRCQNVIKEPSNGKLYMDNFYQAELSGSIDGNQDLDGFTSEDDMMNNINNENLALYNPPTITTLGR